MTRRRWLTSAAVVAGLLVAAIVAVIAFQSMAVPIAQQAGLAPPSTAPCSPAPCVDVEGYTLWVSNVQVAGHLVRMQVKYKNSSNSTHASPEDLSLMDASHSSYKLDTTDTDCNTWTRHEFSGGATFGPIGICFYVNNTTPPFTLHWTPDEGIVCCETTLELKPASATLGTAGCRPASPSGAFPAEVYGTAKGGTVWAWFQAAFPPMSGVEDKTVWRLDAPTATGSPIFTLTGPASHPGRLDWGPVDHGASNWDRPGHEFGTGLLFPSAGCWDVNVTVGNLAGDVYVVVT